MIIYVSTNERIKKCLSREFNNFGGKRGSVNADEGEENLEICKQLWPNRGCDRQTVHFIILSLQVQTLVFRDSYWFKFMIVLHLRCQCFPVKLRFVKQLLTFRFGISYKCSKAVSYILAYKFDIYAVILKGLFTIFSLSFKSHILDKMGTK